MKKYLLATILIAAAACTTHAQTFRAPATETPRERAERSPAPVRDRDVGGAIPRGVRGGNPLQLLNPKAPRRYYGRHEETVTYDPNNPSKVTGIILVGIQF
ncbi:MAG: hypothetical protein ABR589_03005 [Chthoniobacterales bacterium]